jgi:3-oxoadipate enol-lactonase
VDGPHDAPPLVLSNSLGTDLHMWDRQAPDFSSVFRTVRYDARGHGRSDVPRGPYTMEDLGADVIGLLDALEIRRAHFCGVSLGGLIGLWVAAHRPERVDRAVFASTAARIGSPGLWEARARAVRDGGMESVADAVIDRFFSASFRARDPHAVRRIRDTLASTPPDGYTATCLALREEDLGRDLPRIRAPSLVVAGTADVATPLAEAERLHEGIGSSRLAILEGAGHLCNVEQPAAFNEAVVSFLTAASPGGEPG